MMGKRERVIPKAKVPSVRGYSELSDENIAFIEKLYKEMLDNRLIQDKSVMHGIVDTDRLSEVLDAAIRASDYFEGDVLVDDTPSTDDTADEVPVDDNSCPPSENVTEVSITEVCKPDRDDVRYTGTQEERLERMLEELIEEVSR